KNADGIAAAQGNEHSDAEKQGADHQYVLDSDHQAASSPGRTRMIAPTIATTSSTEATSKGRTKGSRRALPISFAVPPEKPVSETACQSVSRPANISTAATRPATTAAAAA